ncbi:hypothetical protein, partial [Achromobacter sp. GbtcB20]|uniref:hypothetical protein n=1 Tax=Achromobacter sp. GbtcB20 TaxID=2824765 RepID=UPI001C2F8499
MIVTSHSPIFVGKVADDLCQIVRVRRDNGVSSIGQVKKTDLSGVLGQGYEFKSWLENYVNDVNVPDNAKGNAKTLL